MSYAIWIALAVVLIAIGPALVRNLRSAGKPAAKDATKDAAKDGGAEPGAGD